MDQDLFVSIPQGLGCWSLQHCCTITSELFTLRWLGSWRDWCSRFLIIFHILPIDLRQYFSFPARILGWLQFAGSTTSWSNDTLAWRTKSHPPAVQWYCLHSRLKLSGGNCLILQHAGIDTSYVTQNDHCAFNLGINFPGCCCGIFASQKSLSMVTTPEYLLHRLFLWDITNFWQERAGPWSFLKNESCPAAVFLGFACIWRPVV